MIELVPTGPTSSDCTYPYDVKMDKAYTVREFIEEVAVGNCWGRIDVKPKGKNSTPICWYGRGGADRLIPDKYADAIVVRAYGGGGWTRYDYTLEV